MWEKAKEVTISVGNIISIISLSILKPLKHFQPPRFFPGQDFYF